MNSTLTCALILDGSEVSFARAELNRVGPNEFSCALGIPRHRQATMVALYEGPVPVTVRLPSKNRRLLQLVCSSGGLFLSFLCALSVTCTTRSVDDIDPFIIAIGPIPRNGRPQWAGKSKSIS